ncbi:MAG: hypothetical protein P4L53_03720 [Candidatus Obscuribacterales bacterium]|nr:hypothetical protein [Candidatus Obscuribacterales bacterium]
MNIIEMILGLRRSAILKMRGYFADRCVFQLDNPVYINREQLKEMEAREVLQLAIFECLIDKAIFFALTVGLALAVAVNWGGIATQMYAHPAFVLLLAALLALQMVKAPRLN